MELEKGRYKHYKGGEYEVLGVARHSENLELLVVYKALYKTKEFAKYTLWVRPLNSFTENVLVDGKKVKRFSIIE